VIGKERQVIEKGGNVVIIAGIADAGRALRQEENGEAV
jgi:hypothetical protein